MPACGSAEPTDVPFLVASPEHRHVSIRSLLRARWLLQERLSPTVRAAALTPEQWLSLYRCWQSVSPVNSGGAPAPRKSGRPSNAHGHGPGASAIPRYY